MLNSKQTHEPQATRARAPAPKERLDLGQLLGSVRGRSFLRILPHEPVHQIPDYAQYALHMAMRNRLS